MKQLSWCCLVIQFWAHNYLSIAEMIQAHAALCASVPGATLSAALFIVAWYVIKSVLWTLAGTFVITFVVSTWSCYNKRIDAGVHTLVTRLLDPVAQHIPPLAIIRWFAGIPQKK